LSGLGYNNARGGRREQAKLFKTGYRELQVEDHPRLE
jgi:hypothetical protein